MKHLTDGELITLRGMINDYALVGNTFSTRLAKLRAILDFIEARIDAPPEGWQCVPIEPTNEMERAGNTAIWKAMLEVAPQC